jgi:hypothetical protein
LQPDENELEQFDPAVDRLFGSAKLGGLRIVALKA